MIKKLIHFFFQPKPKSAMPSLGRLNTFQRGILQKIFTLTVYVFCVVILHQGARGDLRKYSSDDKSETARRLTNLFEAPSPIYIDGRFFEENLIHRTARGEMVRSKSEVIIADRLSALKVEYMYEHPLTIGSATKYPDFTVEDIESGRTFYWEHCGMLHVPSYNRRWEEKLNWYKANGILPHEEGEGEKGTLIVTS